MKSVPETPKEPRTALEIAELMQVPLHFKPKPTPPNALVLAILDRVPGLVHLLEKNNTSAWTLLDWGVITGNLPTSQAHEGLRVVPYIAIAMDALGFLEVPVIYIASAVVGQPVPFTLSNNAKFLYSATLLALTITMVALPPLAPFILVASSAVIFASSLWTAGRLLYQRRQHSKAIAVLDLDIAQEMIELQHIQEKAASLEQELSFSQSETEKMAITSAISDLQIEYLQQKEKIQDLVDTKGEHEEKLALLNTGAIVGKGIAIALSALALAGFVVALFFPPTGLAMVLAAAVTGIAYTVAHFSAPLFKRIGNWFTSKFNKEDLAEEATPSVEDNLEAKQQEQTGDSTTLVFNQLYEDKAPEVLEHMIAEDKLRDSQESASQNAPVPKPSPAPEEESGEGDQDAETEENITKLE